MIDPSKDRLVTLSEAGERLGKTPQAVRMMIYRDEIQAVRIGKRGLRIWESILQQYMQRLQTA